MPFSHPALEVVLSIDMRHRLFIILLKSQSALPPWHHCHRPLILLGVVCSNYTEVPLVRVWISSVGKLNPSPTHLFMRCKIAPVAGSSSLTLVK